MMNVLAGVMVVIVLSKRTEYVGPNEPDEA